MGSLATGPKNLFLYVFQLFLLMQTRVFCHQYQVGDLDAWGLPTSSNPNVYIKWSKNQLFKLGDSLLFLYPPSQDSVIQVTDESYKSCNLKDPILYMNNGNSLFNITSSGEFYFTSGAAGHCDKSQKLHISVPGNGSSSSSSSALSPADGPTATSPSYPTVFGGIPDQQISSSSSLNIPVFLSAAMGILVASIVNGRL